METVISLTPMFDKELTNTIATAMLFVVFVIFAMWFHRIIIATNTAETQALEIVAPTVSYEATEVASWTKDTINWGTGW